MYNYIRYTHVQCTIYFVQDWWNSESYTVYYRKWNIVVHDWLSEYVYRDVKNVSTCVLYTNICHSSQHCPLHTRTHAHTHTHTHRYSKVALVLVW